MDSKQQDIEVMSNYTSHKSDIESVKDSNYAKMNFNNGIELQDMDLFSDIDSSRAGTVNSSFSSFRYGSIYQIQE